MNTWKLKLGLVGLLGVLMSGGLAGVCAAEVLPNSDLRSITGVITGIDVKNGRMQIQSDVGQDTKGLSGYTVNLSKTLVTDRADKQYLVVKDLEVGQRVVIELNKTPIGSPEEMTARNVIVDYPSGLTTTTQYVAVNSNHAGEHVGLMGPRGAMGPVGPTGNQGSVGPRGRTGVALRGPRGETGPAGNAGVQGFTGPRGPAGDLARGPVGEIGPSGPIGQQGAVGKAGEQGASAAGFAGPVGAAGPQGERGPVGNAGEKGSTLYGPTGPSGYAGSVGERGIDGNEGSKGMTSEGIAGLTGASGSYGPRGEKGMAGNQGVAGNVGYWEPYKEFNFAVNQTVLTDADMKKVNEIAHYIGQNPTLQVGIDGMAVRSQDQGQNDIRINAIRKALIDASVSPDRIKSGAMGDRNLRREGRIAVLFATI